MSWVNCIADNDYEIFTEFPFQIRKKTNKRIVKEFVGYYGYVQCCLNRKKYQKHCIVALQFIPNPNNLPEVDHINHNKTDYHLENLRWVHHSENQKNQSSHKGHQYIFLKELPKTAEILEAYNGHDLDGVFVDYELGKVYLFNGVRYRELIPCRSNGSICYNVRDIDDIKIKLYHKVLFG